MGEGDEFHGGPLAGKLGSVVAQINVKADAS